MQNSSLSIGIASLSLSRALLMRTTLHDLVQFDLQISYLGLLLSCLHRRFLSFLFSASFRNQLLKQLSSSRIVVCLKSVRILWQDQTFAELCRFYGIVCRLSFSAHGIFNISISPHVVLIATHPETNMGGLEGHGGDL